MNMATYKCKKPYMYGTGRRKSSVARVRLVAGTGNITVNKKPLEEYFGMELLKKEVRRPLELVGADSKFDVIATVNGGGTYSIFGNDFEFGFFFRI